MQTFSITWTTPKLETKMVRSGFPTTWKVAIKIKKKVNTEINFTTISQLEDRKCHFIKNSN